MKRLLVAVFAVLASAAAMAADDPNLPKLREKLTKLLGVTPEDVQPSEVPGLYQVVYKHEFGYATADGKYLLRGDLLNIDTGEEITEQHRRSDRLAALKALGENNMIVFAPKPPFATKYVMTVFTDVDCGFCRKLHSQIADYNAKGIAIRYLFWPRSGPETESWYKAVAVWCSDDRHAAFTKAKQGGNVPLKTCDNPVEQEYKLGMELGVRGTPSMITQDGDMVQGYVPPKELAAHLAELDAANKQVPKAN
jgi:thiol:disulfide interchange protein DsbC